VLLVNANGMRYEAGGADRDARRALLESYEPLMELASSRSSSSPGPR
jgi:hypothetical protein